MCVCVFVGGCVCVCVVGGEVGVVGAVSFIRGHHGGAGIGAALHCSSQKVQEGVRKGCTVVCTTSHSRTAAASLSLSLSLSL